MPLGSLESTINTAFDARDGISTATKGEVREADLMKVVGEILKG